MYPVGTDIITKYIGRSSNGRGLFVQNTTINKTTGEYTSGSQGASETYMEINPAYTYQKGSEGRLYVFAMYDKDYNYLGYIKNEGLTTWTLEGILPNARYARMATHSATSNWGITIKRIA